jgi:hypothetical protein
MTLLTQRAVVACEEEAAEGTAETLIAADGMLVFNPSFTPGVAMHERDPVRASLSPVENLPGLRQATMAFEVELVGASAGAGNAPHYSDALKACGFGETIVGGTSVTYDPASASIISATLGMWLDGKKYLLWGARGNVTLRLEAGLPGILAFEFTGADWSEADEALLAGVSYESALPPVFLDASLTMDAYAAIVNSVEINFNNAVALRQDANKQSGHISAVITNRGPTATFGIESVLVATYDFLGKWRAGTLVDFDCSIGSVAGNTIAISMPKIQFQNVTPEDREGISAMSIESKLVLTSGDDELSIAIT